MTEQAATSAPPATAELNGQAPPAGAAQPCEDCASKTDRTMGIIALVAAAALAVIAIDLVTGGAVSRALGLGGGEDDSGNNVAE